MKMKKKIVIYQRGACNQIRHEVHSAMHFLKSLELSQIISFSDLCCRHILSRVRVLLRADQGEASVWRLAEETG